MRTLAEKYIDHFNTLEDQRGDHYDGGDQGAIWFWRQIKEIPDFDARKTEAVDVSNTDTRIAFSDGSVLVWLQYCRKWVYDPFSSVGD